MPATLRNRQRPREYCDRLAARRFTASLESDSVSDVSEITDQLPTDTEVLQALLAVARAERDAAIAERDQALSQMDRLRHLLRQLQRAQFGRRSEKLDPEQLLLALEDIEQAVAGNEAAEDKHRALGVVPGRRRRSAVWDHPRVLEDEVLRGVRSGGRRKGACEARRYAGG